MKPNSPNTLVCRPDRSIWFFVVVLLGFTTLAPIAASNDAVAGRSSNDLWPGVAMALICGLGGIALAWYLLHCRIKADDEGITFTDLFKRYAYAWEAVEEFELRLPAGEQGKPRFPNAHLKAAGRWHELPRGYSNQAALLEWVEAKATHSCSRHWLLSELRDDGEWPKTYVYRDVSFWRFFWTSLLFGPWALLAWAAYPAIVRQRPYLGQVITVTLEGLTFTSQGVATFVAWPDVTSYHLETLPGNFQPRLGVVEWNEGRIEFLGNIVDGRQLRSIIHHRAVKAVTREWRYLHGADEDVLGGPASLWQGGKIGVGPKIHHYRTRMVRSCLWFGVVMTVAYAFAAWTSLNGWGRDTSSGDTVAFFVIGFLMAVATLFIFLSFRFTSLHCEEGGLRKISLRGEQFLPWSEVEKLKPDFAGTFVTGAGKRIYVSQFLADIAGLRCEIETRSGCNFKSKIEAANSED